MLIKVGNWIGTITELKDLGIIEHDSQILKTGNKITIFNRDGTYDYAEVYFG